MRSAARITNPYSRACAWLRAHPSARLPLSRQRLSDYRRIALLGDARGCMLDAAEAPYCLVRWVAGPARRDPAQTEQRFHDAVALLRAAARECRQVGRRDVERLTRAYPRVSRRTPTHAETRLVHCV